MNGKRYWAAIIKRAIIALILVSAIGIAIDHMVNNQESREPLAAASITLGSYLSAVFILGVVHFITNWLYLWMFGGNDMVDDVLHELRQLKIPPPNKYEPRNYDYIEILANDEEAEPNDRVKAAVFYGAYNLAMSKGIFTAITIRKALDAAILRYAQEAPRKSKPSTSRGSDSDDDFGDWSP